MNIVNKILVCAAVIAGSQSVGATVVPADDVFVLYTPESPTFTMRQSYGGMYGMAAISLISPKEVTLNMDSEETVKLYYGETLIGEAGTKMTDGSGIANMSVSLMADDGLLEWETPNIWVIMFDDSRPQSMREVGDYSVVIPEGLFLYKEDSLGEKVLNYSLVAQIPDSFSHTVVPENGTEFTTSEPLEQITLTISGTARYVDVEGPVGALYDPEGNRVECTTYKPKVSGTKLTWTIEPAAADFVWSTGEYKFIIPAKSIYVNTSSDYAMAGNYPPQDIEMTYLVVAGKSKIPFESTFTYEVPSQPEFSYTTSYMYEVNNGQGMGAVVLSAPKGLKLNTDCQAAVELMCDGKSVATITKYSGEEAQVHDVTVNYFDDGLIDFGSGRSSWLFVFAEDKSDVLLKAGHYTMKVPSGLFMYEDNIIGAGSLEYDYQGDIKIDYSYTVTPESGSEFTTDSPIRQVTITVGGYVRMLSYAYTPGALYGPDGNALTFESRRAVVTGNQLTWKFNESRSNPVKWEAGEYTFKLPRNTININCWEDVGIEPDFPEEDINVLYILKDDITGVAVSGIERADSYTVYTLDGRAIAVDASSDVLLTLPDGIYIINGKKAHLTR